MLLLDTQASATQDLTVFFVVTCVVITHCDIVCGNKSCSSG